MYHLHFYHFFSLSFILNIFCLTCFQFIKSLFNTWQSTVLFLDCLFTELLNLYYLVLGFLLITHTNTHKHISYTVIINIIFYLLEHNKHSDLKVFDNYNVLVPGGASLLSIILSIVYIGFHFYRINFLSVCHNFILLSLHL